MSSPAAVSSPEATSRLSDWLELTKPRITLMVLITAAAGFLLANTAGGDLGVGVGPLLWMLLGTGLTASGASTLNQIMEREADARMHRTAQRPVPGGRIDPEAALAFGVANCVVGMSLLAWKVNLLTASLSALTILGYALIYTPLKRFTSLSTIIGAVPGAIPPMMGWTAVRDDLGAGAWALFGILFIWQLPHFLAIAWMYREDYARGGFPMLAVRDADGGQTARQMVLWCAALLPVSLLPSVLGLTGGLYFVGALALGGYYMWSCLPFLRTRSSAAARKVLLASVIYLPAILAAMLLDRALG